MNTIQKSSEFVVSCVTDMRRAVTLKVDKELKRPATKERCDWSYGGANEEHEEDFLSLPPTTSLITEQLRSGMSEKAGFSDSPAGNLGSRC